MTTGASGAHINVRLYLVGSFVLRTAQYGTAIFAICTPLPSSLSPRPAAAAALSLVRSWRPPIYRLAEHEV